MSDLMGFKNAIFLVVAYGVFWMGTFLYILTMSQRQRNWEALSFQIVMTVVAVLVLPWPSSSQAFPSAGAYTYR